MESEKRVFGERFLTGGRVNENMNALFHMLHHLLVACACSVSRIQKARIISLPLAHFSSFI